MASKQPHEDQSRVYTRNEYQEDASRTKSSEFFGDNVYWEAVDHLIEDIIRLTGQGGGLDSVKRALYYGTNKYKPIGWREDGIDWDLDEWEIDLLHAAIGIATEAGELLESVWRALRDDDEIDEANVAEELGDLEWYMAVGRNALSFSQEAVQRANIVKLYERYPEVFTSEDAENRDYEQESVAFDEISEDGGEVVGKRDLFGIPVGPAPRGMTRRLGKFALPENMVADGHELFRRVMQECVITRCEYVYAPHMPSFHYVAMSPQFRVLSEMEVVPEYVWNVMNGRAEAIEKNGLNEWLDHNAKL